MNRCAVCNTSPPATVIASTRAATETWCGRCRHRFADALRITASLTPAQWALRQSLRCRCGSLVAAIHCDTRPEDRDLCAACRKRERHRRWYRESTGTQAPC